MSNAAQCTKNAITLTGSSQIISNYLRYGINSILFQRGIYPPEEFQPQQQYGITILMSKNVKICEFLEQVLQQTETWMQRSELDKVSLIITNVHTKETLECWEFKVQPDPDVTATSTAIPKADASGEDQTPATAADAAPPTSNKDLKRIQQEIGSVMRQISATVSYLPLIDCICSFDIHIHTIKDCELPDKWDETQAAYIQNSQAVQLRSFSTGLHKVDTVVNYKLN